MSRGIILYQSKYGATKKYVDWLVEELGYDYAETKNSKVANLLNYDVIILGGGVYASGIAVEMEVAGVQSVCDFYNLELYDFLEAGDVLESSGYEVEGLHGANHNLGKLYIALEIALQV